MDWLKTGITILFKIQKNNEIKIIKKSEIPIICESEVFLSCVKKNGN